MSVAHFVGRRRDSDSKLSATECALLTLLVIAPWPMGMVRPDLQVWLMLGIALVTLLWVVRIWTNRQLPLAACPVLFCLAAMTVLGFFQVVPVGDGVMSSIAPGTAKLYGELLPSEPEVFARKSAVSSVGSAGNTLSLYPYATRQTLVNLLAICVLFFVVRNGVASTAAARRLAIVMLGSGALLALFSFVQLLTSPGDTLFWSIKTAGQVFGSFVNRNHFAMYINICLGLGLGILLSKMWEGAKQPKSRGKRKSSNTRDPWVPWIGLSCGLLLASSILTLSRGGFIALLVAGSVSLTAIMSRKQNLRSTIVVVAPTTIALLLILMFGWNEIWTRFGTMLDEEQIQADRLSLWLRAGEYVRQFPIFGTGMGTFMFVEPMYMHRQEDANTLYAHAHNEYLQTLIEGGVIWLGLSLATVALLIRNVLKTCGKDVRSAKAGLNIGLLFALVTIVTHAIVDFGMHIPAITLTATVLAAFISQAADRKAPASAATAGIQVGLLGRAVASVTVVMLCFIICRESTRYAFVYTGSSSARSLQQLGNLNANKRRIMILEEVSRLAPLDAQVHIDLCQAHLDAFSLQAGSELSPEFRTLTDLHVVPAMEHAIAARSACPVIPLPHVRLAAHTGVFTSSDSPEEYLSRVKRLCPMDATLWYLCGEEEIDLDPSIAWDSWQHSLALSSRYLQPILQQAQSRLTEIEVLETLLPDDAATIVLAANQLDQSVSARREFLEKAVSLYETPRDLEYSATEHHLLALTYYELNRLEKTQQAYRRALSRAPLAISWRYELACVFYNQGKIQDARRELHFILGRQPSHAGANSLMKSVNNEMLLSQDNAPSTFDL